MSTLSAQSVLVESTPAAQSSQQPQETISTTVSVRELDATEKMTRHILMYSFLAAVVLAIGGFGVVTVYLFRYLHHAFASFDMAAIRELSNLDPEKLKPILLARAGLWKFILQSCGIIAGVAFGFLGFALFLLGAKGDMDAAFDDSQHKVQLSRMAPGSFVILIAAVLIGLCAVTKVELKFPGGSTQTVTTSTTSTGTSSPTEATPGASAQPKNPVPAVGHHLNAPNF